MKNRLLLSVVLLGAALIGNAQDQESEDILEQVSEKTRSLESVSADFLFTMDNEEVGLHEENQGSIQLKGQKYFVNLPDVGVKVYSDGESVWNYMESGNQVTINSTDSEESDLLSPSSLFNIYEQGFDSEYIGEKTIDGTVYFEIELFPGDESYDVSKISLLIDKSDMMPKLATLYSTDDTLYGITITSLDTNLNLPDDYFVFDESDYSDLEVIDWR